jgi:hypothetical protein
MAVPIKITQDGRKVEVIGLAVCLDGKPEAVELITVAEHPNGRAIIAAVPGATHMAGRIALSGSEAATVLAALREAEARILASPAAINERFRLAVMRKALVEGIE